MRIELDAADGGARMRVVDDGAGFEPSDAGPSGGRFGLLGMRERARLLGGELSLASSAGRGTSVTAEIPLGPRE